MDFTTAERTFPRTFDRIETTVIRCNHHQHTAAKRHLATAHAAAFEIAPLALRRFGDIDDADRAARFRHHHVHCAVRPDRALVDVTDAIGNVGQSDAAMGEGHIDQRFRHRNTLLDRVRLVMQDMFDNQLGQRHGALFGAMHISECNDDAGCRREQRGDMTMPKALFTARGGGLREQDAISQSGRHGHLHGPLQASLERERTRVRCATMRAALAVRVEARLGTGRLATEPSTEFKTVHSSATSAPRSPRPNWLLSFCRARNN